MLRTSHYGLPYFKQGEFYSAGFDRERFVITDNQLIVLSRIVGDGVFSGWTVCHVEEDANPSTIEIEVHPGVGFINGVVHKTLSIKKKLVFSNVQTSVYMQSQMGNTSGGLKIETQGPASNLASATFVDIVPPATPSGFVATAVDFETINLFWNSNSESDFDHYELWRSISYGPFVKIAEPTVNGISPSFPYQDTGLTANTDYIYNLYAVDVSGNISGFVTASTTTPPDLTEPAEPSGLRLFPSNTAISVIWNPSSTAGSVYNLTVKALNPDGSDLGLPIIFTNIPTLYWQITGLTNGVRYRVLLQAKSVGSILSDGISADATPNASASPLDPLLDTGSPTTAVTSLANAITLRWNASPTPTGSAIGQKNEYRIYVLKDGVSSNSIKTVGLNLSKTVNSYREISANSLGLLKTLQDDVVYVFRITTIDAVGNESAGLYLKGTTLDISPPADPRFLRLIAGDTKATAFWKHSSSADVVGYVLNVNAGPDIEIPYLDKYVLNGLTNGVQATVRVRSKDDNGNLSTPGIIGNVTPLADTTPPVIPSNIQAVPEDLQVVLRWEPNKEEDFDFYTVKRVAIAENLLTVTTRELTETNVLPKAIAVGQITTPPTLTEIYSEDFENLPDMTGNVLFITTGTGAGQSRAISAFDSFTGKVTLATPLQFIPKLNDNISIKVTHPSLGTLIRDVGTATSILDIGLVNGQVYVYYIKATDTRGNESNYSGPILVAPTCGLNDLNQPTNLVATFNVSTIDLTWDQIVPDAEHPATDHTAFNIYRSTSSISGFQLIESVPPTILSYSDLNLINGLTYYYIVTAVRDNAEVIIDTGALQPPSTVLLATLKMNSSTPVGCNISEIVNQQRLLDKLSATIEDETTARLLTHKHTLAPSNRITVEAVPLLAMIDASDLADFDFTGSSINAASQTYYDNLITDKTGKEITYDAGFTYIISPTSIVSGLPYAGDFQVLINGSVPTIEFSIDENRNAVIFAEQLNANDVVTLDGSGTSYYVPAKIDLGYRGFDILLNDVSITTSPSVDEALQTIRFGEALDIDDVVKVVIDPVVPDFGTLPGSRQISLSPNIVLSDFETRNNKLFTLTTGTFEEDDVIFVLVDGERPSETHFVDRVNKTIVFDKEIPKTSTVALEVLNKEEVQGELPPAKVGAIDGSTFSKGRFLKAQLAPISHEGRVKERAIPIFQTLTTDSKYVYQADEGIVGTATTLYALYQFEDGGLLIATSAGLLKTTGFAAFTGEGEETEVTIDYRSQPPSGLKFSSATPDDIVSKTREAAKFSGRFNGYVRVKNGSSELELAGPNMMELDNGNILITGGAVLNDYLAASFEVPYTFIYDPTTQIFTRVADMFQKRRNHSATRLPDGNILVTGGTFYIMVHFNVTTFTPDADDTVPVAKTEIFDILTNTWTPAADMNIERHYHSCTLMNDSEVLVSAGLTGISSYNGLFKPPLDIFPTPDVTSEIFDIFAGTWTLTGSLNRTRVGAVAKADGGVVLVSEGGQQGREIYSRTTEKWTLEGAETETEKNSLQDQFGLNSIDGPVKQFLKDSTGLLLLVSRNNVYASEDGGTFVKTKGLEAVGVVHRIAESSNGTLYAATDLGVYEITSDIHDQLTWFQGGLIGSGTTETFDLQAYDTNMFAGTEIGIFYTTASQNGDVWTQLNTDGKIFEDVFNIEKVVTLLFLNAGKDLYRSENGGLTWSKVGTFNFIDPDAKLVARAPLDLFVVSSTGLYATRNGVDFFLVDFEKNRHPTENNVQMAEVIGSDIIVGYDNTLIAVGPEFDTIILAEFVGTVPTILVNDVEVRGGFRYDIKLGQVVFEVKRFANDVVKATTNYGLYQLVNGPWYRNNPNAAITVFVNGKIQPDDTMLLNSRAGQITFNEDLTKTDIVTASIAGTSLKNEGEFFHSELEDRFEQENGLPLSMGRDYAGNILQMGLSIEHNFLERGIERNQYYCSRESLVDRSFNSFLSNAEFYIMGRREFDRFNSGIDYAPESEQPSIGTRALLPLSALEVSGDLWIGTESGVFVLDPTAAFAIDRTFDIGLPRNAVRDLKFFQGDVWAVTDDGIYSTEDLGITFEKNIGNGLPSSLLVLNSLNNVLVSGADDGIYYSDGNNQTPPYSIWFRCSFVEKDTIDEVFVTEACNTIVVGDGIAYAGIGRGIFISSDGKTWTHVFDFEKGTTVLTMAYFAKKLFVGTNKGVYNDDGSARSATPGFHIEKIETTGYDTISINDMFVYTDGNTTSLYVVGNKGTVYTLTNQTWTPTIISDITAIQKFIIVSGPKSVALANDLVFVQ